MKTQETHHNGADKFHWTAIARRMKDGVSGLPSTLGDRMKSDPYTTLGIAAVAGIGVGIVFGSRILRTALTSAVSYAVVELARTYVRERMPVDMSRVAHVTEGPLASHS